MPRKEKIHQMKRIGRLFGPMLFVVLLFNIVALSSASASEPEWLVGGSPLEAGQKINVNFYSKNLDLILYEDMTTKTDLLCTVVGLEWVLPKGKSEIVAWTCSEPETMGGLCVNSSSVKISAIHLPWTTQLTNPEAGVFVDDIDEGTGGAPGVLVECETILGDVQDECTTEKGETLLTNTTEGMVESEFMEEIAEEEQANCSVGGAKRGLLVGDITREALVGGVQLVLAYSVG
jgi:hypothetical protein